MSEECLHKSVVEGVCLDCEMEMDSNIQYVGYSHKPHDEIKSNKSTVKSIMPELESLGLKLEVRERANAIFQDMETTTKKGKTRNMQLFYCVYNACNDFNIVIDERGLAEKLKIENRQITRALSKFILCQKTYKPSSKLFSITDMLNMIFEKLKSTDVISLSDDDKNEIVKITDRLISKEPQLKEEPPIKIAGAIIQYFLTMHDISFKKKEFAAIVGRSDVTINNCLKRLISIDNK